MRRHAFPLVVPAVMLCALGFTKVHAQSSLTPGFDSTSGTPPQPGRLADTVSAPPLTTGEKFNYSVVQTFAVRGLLGAAVSASIGQATNTPGKWGQGFEGYADRYASAFGGSLVHQTLAFGLDTALHEDPRYFPSKKRTRKARAVNALKQVFFTKKDDGSVSFAYGRVVSTFAAAQIVNAWQPRSNNSFGDGLLRGLIGIGAEAGYNFMQEFIPFTRPKSIRGHP